ncbi:hypothetical protein BDV23DRAFT_186170 [Aspergillus alliaceus]|uniref:Uncharacterized protein n=1 Tax=Petromyces alliaceus TaxID=209559 RepID=A0A5N7C0L2_PETAA|nr:hypothetical protein BDV23DRAFT_186170 [Aspergillus alliaceus]
MGEKGKDHQHAGNAKDLEEDPQRIYYGDIEACRHGRSPTLVTTAAAWSADHFNSRGLLSAGFSFIGQWDSSPLQFFHRARISGTFACTPLSSASSCPTSAQQPGPG